MDSRKFVLFAFSVVPPLAVALLALLVVPRFQGVFRSFNANLPLETQLLLASYQWWAVLPLVAAALAWHYRGSVEHLARLLVASCVLSFLLFLFAGFSCYSPIIRLAAET